MDIQTIGSIDQEQLARDKEKLVGMVSANMDVDAFLSICVQERSKHLSIETNLDTLFDFSLKPIDKQNEIREKYIPFLKGCKLKDVAYENEKDLSEFRIVNTVNKELIPFSNRNSSMYELRGSVLREQLTELKKNLPENDMSLYQALNLIIGTKIDIYVVGFMPLLNPSGVQDLNSIRVNDEAAGDEDRVVQLWKNEKVNTNIMLALNNLSLACIRYIKEGQEKGISEENSTKILKSVLEKNKQEIIYSAITTTPREEEYCFKLFKDAEAEIKQAEIKEIEGLIKDLINLANEHQEYQAPIDELRTHLEHLRDCQKAASGPSTKEGIAKEVLQKITDSTIPTNWKQKLYRWFAAHFPSLVSEESKQKHQQGWLHLKDHQAIKETLKRVMPEETTLPKETKEPAAKAPKLEEDERGSGGCSP